VWTLDEQAEVGEKELEGKEELREVEGRKLCTNI